MPDLDSAVAVSDSIPPALRLAEAWESSEHPSGEDVHRCGPAHLLAEDLALAESRCPKHGKELVETVFPGMPRIDDDPVWRRRCGVRRRQEEDAAWAQDTSQLEGERAIIFDVLDCLHAHDGVEAGVLEWQGWDGGADNRRRRGLFRCPFRSGGKTVQPGNAADTRCAGEYGASVARSACDVEDVASSVLRGPQIARKVGVLIMRARPRTWIETLAAPRQLVHARIVAQTPGDAE